MFKEVTDILFYDGEYNVYPQATFFLKNVGGFEISALFFGHAQSTIITLV